MKFTLLSLYLCKTPILKQHKHWVQNSLGSYKNKMTYPVIHPCINRFNRGIAWAQPKDQLMRDTAFFGVSCDTILLSRCRARANIQKNILKNFSFCHQEKPSEFFTFSRGIYEGIGWTLLSTKSTKASSNFGSIPQ